MARDEEYNWLDDPFDEKKAAQAQQDARMSGRSKLMVGLGCLGLIVVVAVLAVVGGGMLLADMSNLAV
ncbi:MAG TPA: hypothetical protein IAC12_03510 [Candidatus Aphodovivens avistercoris]|nr:hypothetical protein [Candidatus Aphodovivens avistercoris]